jgi:hypothetical protein
MEKIVMFARKLIIFTWIISSILTLNSCANSPASKTWEDSLAADPQLPQDSNSLQPDQTAQPTISPTPSFISNIPDNISTSPTPSPVVTNNPIELPAEFPQQKIPLYSNANLIGVENNGLTTRWQSTDPINMIETFYTQHFTNNNWQLTTNPNNQGNNNLLAQRNNLQVEIGFAPPQTAGGANEFIINYLRTDNNNPDNNNPNINNQNNNQNNNPVNDPVTVNPTVNPTINPINPPVILNNTPAPTLADVPNALNQYVADWLKLGILNQPNLVGDNPDMQVFQPMKNITRREFTRWLFQTHNQLYADNLAKQIRLASADDKPIFQDIPTTDPDYGIIQGLAEAGLIPSPLSGDLTKVLFKPDNLLSRQDLILWKVPLDIRQQLPKATIEAVKETWGFQDASKISGDALRAILVDYNNGDLSNIRRVYGYTTIFQPDRPVTRAEAAATLWYFGFQTNGVSVPEALQRKAVQPANSSTANSPTPLVSSPSTN